MAPGEPPSAVTYGGMAIYIYGPHQEAENSSWTYWCCTLMAPMSASKALCSKGSHELPKQSYQLETKCSNTQAFGEHFTFKPLDLSIHWGTTTNTPRHSMLVLLRNQWQKEILAIGQSWEHTAYRERGRKKEGRLHFRKLENKTTYFTYLKSLSTNDIVLTSKIIFQK